MSNASTVTRSTNPVTVLLTNKLFVFVLRIFLGALFIFSSVHKIQQPDQFAITVRAYNILPIGATNVFSLLVAWTEVVAGALLILGVLTKKAAGAVLILLVLFIAAVSTMLVRGLVIDCGCFGADGGTTGAGLIVRNLFLLAATLIVMIYDRNFLALSRIFSRGK